MKKSVFAAILSLVSVLSASAIGPDVFNHIGFGASVGLTGISIEAATPSHASFRCAQVCR